MNKKNQRSCYEKKECDENEDLPSQRGKRPIGCTGKRWN
jgi:hypothetical protein